jgi:hypothetical protein
VKPPDQLDTIKAGKTTTTMILYPSMQTIWIQMVTSRQKTRRKFLVCHHQTKSSEAMTVEKTSIIKEMVSMTMGEGADGAQICLYTACIMRKTQIKGQKIALII